MLTNRPVQTTEDEPEFGKSHVLLLAVALISASSLTFPAWIESPLLLDEHVSYWVAGQENPGSLWERSLDYAATPPLSSVMQRMAVTCGGRSSRALRLPSAICFLAAIVGVFLTGSALRQPTVGGVAALLLAWHPEAVDWMRVARPYGLSMGLSAWALWCTVQWARDPQRMSWAVGWTCINAALVWTHYLNLPLVLLQAVTLCGFRWFRLAGQDRGLRGVWLALVVLGLLLSPLWPACRRIAEWAPLLNYRQAPPSLMEMIGPLWWAGLPLGLATAGALSALKLGRAVSPAEGPRTRGVAVFAVWGVAPMLLLAVGAEAVSPSLGEMRYRIVYAPAGCLLIASLLERVRQRFRRGRSAGTYGILLPAAAVCMTAAWWSSGSIPWRSQMLNAPAAPDWETLALELDAHSADGEPVFVASGLIEQRLVPAFYDDPVFMDYTSCRLGRFYVRTAHPRYALPWVWPPSPDLAAYYRHVVSESSGTSHDVVWVAGGTDTDLGRGGIEGVSLLLRESGFRETGRWEQRTAALLQFRRGGAS